MATEMVLIPKAAYERLQLSDNKLELDTNMEVGHNAKSDNNEKLDIMDASSSSSSSSSSRHEEEAAGQVIHENDNKNNDDNDNVAISMIELFPPKYKLYAKRLLTYIKRHGGKVMAWNDDDNALIYNGSKVEGSDIVELITHLFKSNRPAPVGTHQFRKGSDKIRVPKAFLKPYMLKPPGMPKSIKNKWVKY
jgi:hypothetical protein